MERAFVFFTNLTGGGAYGIIFGVLVACGLGLPLPEDIPLVATGYLIWDKTMSISGALLVTLLGVLVGDSILFYLGRKIGPAIFFRQGNRSLFSPKRMSRARAYFRKYGDKIVFFARFVVGLRAATFFVAGAMRMRYRRFVILDGLAAILSVPIWIGLGYFLGFKWGYEIAEILHSLRHYKSTFTTTVLCIVLVALIHTLIKYRKMKRMAAKPLTLK